MKSQIKEKSETRIFGDNYVEIKELGRGGMGAVYLARDIKLQRQVAVKVLDLHRSNDGINHDKAVYNFKREAIAIANLNHENIVNIHDIGEENNTHYIVMELIEGQPVSKILKIHPLFPGIVLSIIVQICSALSYVHRNGVIHRDIKPENIMLLGKGFAKLTDFGIAKFSENKAVNSEDGDLIGTILYMPPEQLRNSDDVDERSDLYALAVSLYEMLTGRLPFNGDNIGDVIMKILTEEPIPPSSINPDLPEAIDNIILKALSKDRDFRYSSVKQFEKEIRNISEYKDLLKMQDMRFAQARGGGEGGNGDLQVNSNEIFKNNIKKHVNVYETKSEKFSNEVDLTWLDKLGFLMEEEEKIEDEKSFLLDSFNFVTPYISVSEVKNLLTTLKSVTDHREILNFLSSFDGVKSIKQLIEGNVYSNIFDKYIECADKSLIPSHIAQIINGLNFVISLPVQLRALLITLRNLQNPSEIINFLDNIDGEKNFRQIIEEFYSIEKSEYLLNLLYECHQQEIIKIKAFKPKAEMNILVGDMLVAFSYITQPQLRLALNEKNLPENTDKPLGEILVKFGFLSKEKLLNVLKLQLWYKKLF